MEKYIRQIFSVFALVMIAVFVVKLRAGEWSLINWMLLGTAAVCCVLVFRVFVYIFNFSYALVSLINGSLLAILFGNGAALLLGGAMAVYGLRLLVFTWTRTRSESYAERVANIEQADAQMPAPIKGALWFQCSFLYGFHLYAVYLAGQNGVVTTSVIAGAAIILLGTFIEGLADAQKQAFKTVSPKQFISTGLFSRWRHPNYGGEILVQVGLIVAGVGAVTGDWLTYVAAVVAPLYIVLLMISECGRADKYMQLRYGEQAEFQAYAGRSGCYLPRIG